MLKVFTAVSFAALAFSGTQLAAQAPAPISQVAPAAIAADPANRLTLQLSNGGSVVILLRPDAAPNHVQRIQTLVRQGFYNGLKFHRVIPGFMAQTGDPKGTGEGGSTLPDMKNELNRLLHVRGTVGAARSQDLDSANSQFYIMFGPNGQLEGRYTVIGRVISGMEFVDKIAPGEPPAEPTTIVRATVGA